MGAFHDLLHERMRESINKAIDKQILAEDYALLYGRPPKPEPPTVTGYGTVKLDFSEYAINTNKVNTMATPFAKKYRATLSIQATDVDRGTVTVQQLLQVDLAADDFSELVKAAHGHLELVSDK